MVDGPVALITGAARGIGAATARRLAAEGWRLVLVDRAADDEALPYALASVDELHAVAEVTDAVAVVADVRDQAALDRAVTIAVTSHGRLDAAIAVAGAMAGGPVAWETDDAAWHVNIGVNLEGVHRLARASVPALLAQPEPRRGRFVAVSSAAGTTGRPRLAAYTAAKHGVIGYMKSLAIELAPFGITANTVAPGATRGSLLDASAPVYDLDSVDEFVVHHPLGRLLEPDEIAAGIAWLCSDGASGVTGIVLPVDAGMTAG
jgi:SDR family mycofactocin-dependent oxidoreductase